MTDDPAIEAAMLAELEPLLESVLEPDAASDRTNGPDEALSLRSIEVITLVDLLEARFDRVFSSDEVNPANFATRRSIAAMLIAMGARCD